MIFRIIGYGLVLLGGASGLALFCQAVFVKNKIAEGRGTLWGLFILGLAGGTIILASTN
ncbi:MAG: hypothetical protein V1784_00085 [bacterium]